MLMSFGLYNFFEKSVYKPHKTIYNTNRNHKENNSEEETNHIKQHCGK